MRTAYEHGFDVITLTDCMAATLERGARERAISCDFPMFSTPMTSRDLLMKLAWSYVGATRSASTIIAASTAIASRALRSRARSGTRAAPRLEQCLEDLGAVRPQDRAAAVVVDGARGAGGSGGRARRPASGRIEPPSPEPVNGDQPSRPDARSQRPTGLPHVIPAGCRFARAERSQVRIRAEHDPHLPCRCPCRRARCAPLSCCAQCGTSSVNLVRFDATTAPASGRDGNARVRRRRRCANRGDRDRARRRLSAHAAAVGPTPVVHRRGSRTAGRPRRCGSVIHSSPCLPLDVVVACAATHAVVGAGGQRVEPRAATGARGRRRSGGSHSTRTRCPRIPGISANPAVIAPSSHGVEHHRHFYLMQPRPPSNRTKARTTTT